MNFLNEHEKVILKPIDLSRGRGICIIEKEQFGYRILDYRDKECVETILENDHALKIFLKSNSSFFE